ncbi:MAG: tetratricopeptide repeat protein [Fimbriimonadaceae bacterium]|nr:tetratricopeptide repeat protein [Fimbriimonadaceae bacterium]
MAEDLTNTPETGDAPQDAAPVSTARDSFAEDLAEGHRLLSQGREEEAERIAREILSEAPAHAAALALLGDVRERQERLEEAVALYRQVLVLRPDSVLDRLRLEQLERAEGISAIRSEPAEPRNAPLMMAGAAFVVIMAVGLAIIAWPRGDRTAQATPPPPPSYSTFEPSAPVPTASGEAAATGQAVTQADPAAGATPAENPGYIAPRGLGSARPSQSNAQGATPPTLIEPLNPQGAMPGMQVQPVGGRQDFAPPVAPPAAPPIASAGGGPTPEEPEVIARQDRGPGMIDIRPSNGQPTRAGNSGSQPVQDPAERKDDEDARQSVGALVQTARDAFIAGDYSRAASAYEQALRRGAARAGTNQRLAETYVRLGRNGDAAAAYRRAIAAYEAILARGPDAVASAALEACKRALDRLQ